MKILAVCIGPTDGGCVSYFYRRIICELALTNDVDVLCSTPSQGDFANLRNFYCLPYSKKEQGWSRRFVRWFGTTPISRRWGEAAAKIVADDYDVVLSMTSSIHLDAVVCGRCVAERKGCKFAIYTVDAIPAPGGWTRRRSEFRGKMKVVARNFAAADYLAASNSHMLAYQLGLFNHKEGLVSDVVYTVAPENYIHTPASDEILFLYAGELYGLRNPDHFFKAFRRLLKVYPTAEFMIVGRKKRLGNMKSILNAEEQKQITVGSHTSDLAPLFSRAMVLVDIDADREKDPFLSSKIITYMQINRVILSETGRETPSRELFAGMNTVVQCDHNEESLYEGMLRAIEVAKSNPDFSERDRLNNSFSPAGVTAVLERGLQSLLM
ncbi:MAG: hypothetical protein IIX40_07145 [Alistipes sp.]|nr:hypothetical protein [Alistipes sp.]